jgi:DMSO reductase anchor subunit
MIKSFNFFATIFFFSVISLIHFLRLTFEWQVFFGPWIIPAWLSGLIVAFSVFMIYCSIKLKKKSSLEEYEKNSN